MRGWLDGPSSHRPRVGILLLDPFRFTFSKRYGPKFVYSNIKVERSRPRISARLRCCRWPPVQRLQTLNSPMNYSFPRFSLHLLLGMWGFHDRLLTLRKALHHTLTGSPSKGALWRRWRWHQTLQNKQVSLVYSDATWEQEWNSLVKLSSTIPRYCYQKYVDYLHVGSSSWCLEICCE
jgi:hypothetical protein